MTFHQYSNETEYVNLYGKLLERLYKEHTDYVAWRFAEFKRNINNDNPFLEHGIFQNFIFVEKGEPVAHISVMLNNHLPQEVGLIGYFDCINDLTIAREVFGTAVQFLREHGKKIIRGPIQFTTWQSFRIACSGGGLPFLTEPYNLEYYKNLFEDFGFSAVQNSITRARDISKDGISMDGADYRTLLSEGFSFERVSAKTATLAMCEIYAITSASFRDTLSFTGISFEEFEYQYRGIEKMVDESVIFIVRNPEGLAIAFCFTVPDLFNKIQKSLVIKTMGVLPKYQDRGVGRALLYIVELIGVREGFTRFLYSTMRVDNKKIQSMTSGTKDILRSYSVYELNI